MTVYCSLIAVCLVSTLLSFRYQEGRKLHAVLLAVIIACFIAVAAFRFQVGADYQHYINEYEGIRLKGPLQSYTEIGFSLLCSLLSTLGFSFLSIFAVSAVIIYASFGYAVHRLLESKYWCLALSLYLLLGFFFVSLNIIRQYIAIAFIILAFALLWKTRSYRIFAIFVLVGSLFHYSALFALVIIPLAELRSRVKSFDVLVPVLLFSLVFSIVDIRSIVSWILPMMGRWNFYIGSDLLMTRDYLAFAKNVVPNAVAGLYLFHSMRGAGDGRGDRRENALATAGVAYCASLNVFYGVMVLSRLADLFLLGYIWLIIQAVAVSKRKTAVIGCIVAYGLLLTVVSIFMGNGNGVLPYQTIIPLLAFGA